VAYNGSDGTLNWLPQPWTEIGETNGVSSGDVRVVEDLGDNSIRIARSGRGVSRLADLSGYSAATLTFDYRRVSFDAATDYVMVQASNDDGISWTELGRYSGPGTDSSYVAASYDISTYIAANTMIRFLSSGLASNDYFYVDNVQIAASVDPATTAGGTPPDLLSDTTLLGGQQMTVTYAVEVDSPLAGGTQFTNTASVTSTGMPALESSVTSTVSEMPPSAVDDSGATDEDTVLNVAAPGVLENDVDLNGDSLTITTYDATSAGGASVMVYDSGSYRYDPTGVAAFQALAAGESMTDTFTYTIDDGNGGSDTATVTITVSGVNDGPTAVDDAGSTDEDTVLTVPATGVLGNDTDPDATDTLAVTTYDTTSARGAAVTVNANGGYSYDPTGVAALQALAAGESVTDTFTYTIGDGHGGSDTATVIITVSGVNDGPTAVDDSGATDEDTVLNGAAPGVLGNDTDPDGSDVLTVTGYNATSVRGAAVAVNADGGYSYDPTGVAVLQAMIEGDSVMDSFTYTLADGHGGSATATVTVEVAGRNDVPVVANQVFNVAENSPDNTVVGTVNATDADSGDVLTYTVVAGDPEALFTLDPTTGVLTVNDGSELDFETTPTYVLTVMVTDRHC
jgi:VCBS repeat-containing protein